VKVQQDFDGTWSVWDGEVLLVGDLPTHAAAYAELDRRERRANYKPSSTSYRMGSFDHPGKVTPWTNPKARKGKLWRRLRGNNRKHKHGRSQ
jgi:hypothetical protein